MAVAASTRFIGSLLACKTEMRHTPQHPYGRSSGRDCLRSEFSDWSGVTSAGSVYEINDRTIKDLVTLGRPMVSAMQPGSPGGAPSPSGLADVIDTILDKGLVIDAYVRVSLVGIELLTIDARVVVASVDTYLRFAEAVNRLDISQDKQGLPEVFSKENTARNVTKGVLDGVGEKLREFTGPDPKRAPRRSR